MRKKFVINFITLLVILIFGIALIRPEVSQVLANRKDLSALREKLAGLNQKAQKIEQLNQELSQNPKNQETVLKYIPVSRSEDSLINYLDGVSYAEGIGIKNVVLSEKSSNDSTIPVVSEDNQGYPEGTLPLVLSPQPVFLTTKLDFFSSYEKVIVLLEKINGLKRFNETTYLKITKTYPEDKKEDASLNFLQVELGLDFNYLKKIASQSEVGDDIFKKEGFDNEVLKKIEEKAVNDAVGPENKSDGRNNPFIP